MPNEFLLVIDDGDAKLEDVKDEDVKPQKPRVKGAYYKNIERKMLLKKKRQNVSARLYIRVSLSQCASASQAYEAYGGDKWDIIKITHAQMSPEEENEREEALAEVMDPMYLLSRADADAEGEIDDTVVGTSGVNGDAHGDRGITDDALEVFGE